MIEAQINKDDLRTFLLDLRKADMLEMKNFFKKDFEEKFIETCFDKNNEIYFLKTDDNYPLALGGVYCINNIGQVWLLTTNKFYQHKKDVLKYVFLKIENFKTRFDILFNFIYKTNFSSLKWLKKAGFSVSNLDNCSDYKVFYFSKGAKFDLRYFTR